METDVPTGKKDYIAMNEFPKMGNIFDSVPRWIVTELSMQLAQRHQPARQCRNTHHIADYQR